MDEHARKSGSETRQRTKTAIARLTPAEREQVEQDADRAGTRPGPIISPEGTRHLPGDNRERETEPRPGLRGILLQQFRASIKALTQHAPAPTPAVRRRRKEDTGKAFQMAAATVTKRERVQEAVHQAIAYLWDTLDWLNPWQQGAGSEHDAELQHDEAHHLSLHL